MERSLYQDVKKKLISNGQQTQPLISVNAANVIRFFPDQKLHLTFDQWDLVFITRSIITCKMRVFEFGKSQLHVYIRKWERTFYLFHVLCDDEVSGI